MNFAGESGVAAFTIINYIRSFVILIMFGISDGISPIISSNYGAGKMEGESFISTPFRLTNRKIK